MPRSEQGIAWRLPEVTNSHDTKNSVMGANLNALTLSGITTGLGYTSLSSENYELLLLNSKTSSRVLMLDASRRCRLLGM